MFKSFIGQAEHHTLHDTKSEAYETLDILTWTILIEQWEPTTNPQTYAKSNLKGQICWLKIILYCEGFESVQVRVL